MDYVLYAYGVAVLLLVLIAAVLGRRLFQSVTGPITPAEPRYRPGSPSWRRQQHRAEAASYAAPMPVLLVAEPAEPTADEVAREVAELEAQLARVTAPEVEGATIIHWETPPAYVQAEMGDHGGAEMWGDLLSGMTTEEQTIYNLQMVLDHDEHMEVERGFLSDLDRAVNDVLARLAKANEEAERRALYWEASAARRGTFVDAPTGAWPVLQPV